MTTMKKQSIPIPGTPGVASVITATHAPDGSLCTDYWCPTWRVHHTKYHWLLLGFVEDSLDAEPVIVIPHSQFAQWAKADEAPDDGNWVYSFTSR